MDAITLETAYQRVEAEPYPLKDVIELNFNTHTLYLPGDRFRYNGQVYIVKQCYQAGDQHAT